MIISLTYVTEVDVGVENSSIEFVLPSTGFSASKLPPTVNWSSLRVGMEFNLITSSTIQQIQCSPDVKMKKEVNGRMASLSSSQDILSIGSEFRLWIQLQQPHQPTLWIEEDENKNLVSMLSFFPDFEYKDLNTEIVILLDRQ